MIPGLILGFGLLALFAVDALLARRTPDRPVRSAVIQFSVWTALGLAAAVPVALLADGESAGGFLTVLVLEKTLSIDNVAAFAGLLGGLGVAVAARPKLVGQGITLSLVLRTGLLLAGLAVVDRIHALLPAMGALLLVLGIRMARHSGGGHAEGAEPAVPKPNRLMRRFPASGPLLVLAVTDIVFAVDSIPAALAVTRDAYVVIAATGLSMLGMRPAYLLLEHGLKKLRYLNTGVAAVLVALGLELAIGHWVAIPDLVTLGIALTLLGGSVVASLLRPVDQELALPAGHGPTTGSGAGPATPGTAAAQPVASDASSGDARESRSTVLSVSASSADLSSR